MPKNKIVDFIYLIFGEPHISDRDRVLLTSFNQWRKYKNFPIRILVDFFIVFFLTAQALMLSSEFISYNNSNQATFQTIFYPEEYRDGIYSIDDFLFVIQSTVENYYKFPMEAVNRYTHLTDETGEIKPIEMTVKRYQNLDGTFWNFTAPFTLNYVDDEDFSGDFNEVYNEFNLTMNNPLGIFGEGEGGIEGELDRRSMIYYITTVELKFSFLSVNVGTLAVLPFKWDVYSKFSISGGQIDYTLSVTYRINHTTGISGYDIFTSMTMILIILSILAIFKSLQEIFYCRKVYQRVKGKYIYLSRVSTVSDDYPNWESIPSHVKLAFFSFWTSLHIFGCFCIAFASILSVFGMFGFSTSSAFYIVYGIGSMLACFNILRYFEYNKMLFLHISTLRNAIAHIIRFLLSVFPIFWAYVIFGVLNFGPYSWKFANLDQASVTLFALLTGDDIHDTFYDLAEGGYPIVSISRIYIYTFVVVFITSVLNVFIFIIQDAYTQARISLGIDPPPDNDSSSQSPSLDKILIIIFDNLDKWTLRMMENSNFNNHFQLHNLNNDFGDCENDCENDKININIKNNFNNNNNLNDDLKKEEESLVDNINNNINNIILSESSGELSNDDLSSSHSSDQGAKKKKKVKLDGEMEKLFQRHQEKFMKDIETKIKESQLLFAQQLQKDIQKLLRSRNQ